MPELTVKDVFSECQHGVQSHGMLCKNLLKIYNKTSEETFWETFIKYLKFSLVVYKREPVVERTLDFVAKFATSLDSKAQKDGAEENTDDEDAEEMNPILRRLFDFLLSHHNACERSVRFRCCQMINKLLYKIGDDAQLDDWLYDKIYDCMLQRLRDKVPAVRVQAIFALTRLQDPANKECPIIEAYMFLLGYDPNADVRRAALVCIAPSTKTLPALFERTRDVSDAVRKLAFKTIAEKVHIKALTIAQRIQLLQNGLTDRVAGVKDACGGQLVQAWLRTFGGNVLELINCLDVETSSETTNLMLKTIFNKVPPHELVNNFDLLNQDLVIPVEEFTCESVFYWRSLSEHLKSLGVDAEPHLEKILPTGSNLCNYMREMFKHMKGEEDLDVRMRNEFIMQQLLELVGFLDLADEVGRRAQCQLIKDLLLDDSVGEQLIAPLLLRYNALYPNHETRINNLVEIISDIIEPLTDRETGPSASDKRKLDMQVANVRVKLNQLREELDECVERQEFERAVELKAAVKELEESRTQLLEQSAITMTQTRTERTDPETQLKCMTIIAEMLKDASLPSLIPSLQTLVEVRIYPGITNEDPAIRNLAVKSLGLCCLISKAMAQERLILFVQVSQMDVEIVRVTALKIIIDLLLTFGLNAFQINSVKDSIEEAEKENAAPDNDDDGETPMEDDTEGKARAASSILHILSSMLDDQTGDILAVVAEGLAKLLLLGRLESSKLLSRLILLWYNPITEDETYLRHCLGTFFPVYAFASRGNQDLVEESIMPTMKTLFNAPACSPLAQVNAINVAELLIQLCNSRNLANPNAKQENICHDNLAMKICNEILSDPNSFNVQTLVKMLNMLELSPDHISLLKDLKVLGERMLKEVKEKKCVKMLEKFQRHIKDCIHKHKDANVDGEREDNEVLVPETQEVNDTQAANDTQTENTQNQTQENETEAPEAMEDTQLEGADELNVTHRPLGRRRGTSVCSTHNTTANTTINTTISSPELRSSASEAASASEDPMQTDADDKKARRTRGTKKKLRGTGAKDKKSATEQEDIAEEANTSTVENEVFASPTPVRRGRRGKAVQSTTTTTRSTRAQVDKTRMNLEEALDSQDAQSDIETSEQDKDTSASQRKTRASRRTRTRAALSDIENEVS